MRRSCFIIPVSAALAALAAGCGGATVSDDNGGAPKAAMIGTVDLGHAPSELAMTCDHGVGRIAFDNPCLVGQNLNGVSSSPGVHEVECTLQASSHPVAWTFLLILANPAASLRLPDQVPRGSPTGMPFTIDGRRAGISGVSGTLSFSRVDPANRAFVAQLTGTMIWTDSSGATFSCAVDDPLWGAPGNFL